MRARRIFLICASLLVGILLGWAMHRPAINAPARSAASPLLPSVAAGHLSTPTDATAENAPTDIYAHNLLLRKGPAFRVYILWMRGKLLRTEPARTPTFDDASTFVLNIQKGVLYVKLQDLARYLNAAAVPHARVTGVRLSAEGGQFHLYGTAHRIVPLPIEVVGTLSASADQTIRLHVNKIRVLKIPVKALLGDLRLQLADLIESNQTGIRVEANDVIFDTQRLMPAPHITGPITSVLIGEADHEPAIHVIYGDAEADSATPEQWHNFLQLTNGTLDFGKLTMHHVDLIMIDSSKDPWFDLDLIKYQAQLVDGIVRMTPQAGLQIFMPNVNALSQKNREPITLGWPPDRTLPPPPERPR